MLFLDNLSCIKVFKKYSLFRRKRSSKAIFNNNLFIIDFFTNECLGGMSVIIIIIISRDTLGQMKNDVIWLIGKENSKTISIYKAQ